jgi:hypothetical protein
VSTPLNDLLNLSAKWLPWQCDRCLERTPKKPMVKFSPMSFGRYCMDVGTLYGQSCTV